MGGLHSGRKRKHTIIDDCIVLDLAQFKKMKMLHPGTYTLAQKNHVTNFIKETDHTYTFKMYVAPDCITLSYQAVDTEQEYIHLHPLSLTQTPCNYGGSRLWFLAPCCGQRVRVLYINPRQRTLASIKPQCRDCMDLHYKSQMSSYIERHKTYERFLLANYGLTWAANRYDELKEHYLEMTPELMRMKMQSEFEQHMKMIILLLRLNRSWRREHARVLNSLKSEGDQTFYIHHMLKEWGSGHALDVARRLHKQEKREHAERTIVAWLNKGEQHSAPLDLTNLIARKNQLKEDMEM